MPIFAEAGVHFVNVGGPRNLFGEKLLYAAPLPQAETGESSAPVVPAEQHLALHATAIQLGVAANRVAARMPHA